MVATEDIAEPAAGVLQEPWSGHRVVELKGPRRLAPNDIAAASTKVLGRSVRMQIAPRDSWEEIFRPQGMRNPLPRMRMLDGFNEVWIEFEGAAASSRKVVVSLESVLQGLISASYHVA